jgi:hypothetical protein
MMNVEAASAEARDRRLHCQLVVEPGRDQKLAAGLHDRDDNTLRLHQVRSRKACSRKESSRASVEPFEILRVEYDARGVAVSLGPCHKMSGFEFFRILSEAAQLIAVMKFRKFEGIPPHRIVVTSMTSVLGAPEAPKQLYAYGLATERASRSA